MENVTMSGNVMSGAKRLYYKIWIIWSTFFPLIFLLGSVRIQSDARFQWFDSRSAQVKDVLFALVAKTCTLHTQVVDYYYLIKSFWSRDVSNLSFERCRGLKSKWIIRYIIRNSIFFITSRKWCCASLHPNALKHIFISVDRRRSRGGKSEI